MEIENEEALAQGTLADMPSENRSPVSKGSAF
jgi:hypothetical protein